MLISPLYLPVFPPWRAVGREWVSCHVAQDNLPASLFSNAGIIAQFLVAN